MVPGAKILKTIVLIVFNVAGSFISRQIFGVICIYTIYIYTPSDRDTDTHTLSKVNKQQSREAAVETREPVEVKIK